jgi:putative FmdB family regulatory protein
MPVYEYVCQSCKRTFSVLILRASDEKVTCPDCGSEDVLKKFSTFSCGVQPGSLFQRGGG